MTDSPQQPEQEQRRTASAKFVLQNQEDSSIQLREAMDTAHRSLTDSLQLSFRALQVVMIVLLGLYLISGFRTVEDSQTGVATFFGSIVGDQGLSSGLQTNWPAPIGGFEIFDAQNRGANLGRKFKPNVDARLTQEQRILKAQARNALRPGVDGYLLTSDGDIAHIGISAEWEIIDPLQYSSRIIDLKGNEIVELALENATVHIIGEITLENLLDKPLEELRAMLRLHAQDFLNDLKCGIRISDVILPTEPEPPLFIQKILCRIR